MRLNNIFEFDGYRPVVDDHAFVHPNATVTGNVRIGPLVYVGAGAAVRGDWGPIHLERGCNVQENCTIHTLPGVTTTLQPSAHIGHGAVIHAATIGRNALIGMNAVIMHHAIVGEESVVGALAFVPSEMIIPDRKLALGNPAQIVRDVSQEMIRWKTAGTRLYQELPEKLRRTLRSVEPLREPQEHLPPQERTLLSWEETKRAGKTHLD